MEPHQGLIHICLRSNPTSGINRKLCPQFIYIVLYRSKPFFYNISGLNFNLDEIKHGILRGNKKSPKAYLKTLAWNDPKAQIIKEVSFVRCPNMLQ